MNPNNNLLSRQRATAKETNQALQVLSFTNPLRTVSNAAKDDGELISSKTPTSANIGHAKSLGESITASMSSAMQQSRPKQEIKRSASSELLKTEDLVIYQSACTVYKLGLGKGWSKKRLLESVEEWKVFDGNSQRKLDAHFGDVIEEKGV